jgi:predicted anti-sigma-YlaC factor YlaD
MSGCENYELYISALLDGESSREDVLSVLDHLPGCASCRAFYVSAREIQHVIDARPTDVAVIESLEIAAAPLPAAPAPRRQAQVLRLTAVPRWTWAAAAALLLALAFWLYDGPAGLDAGGEPGRSTSTIDITLEAHKGQMSEAEFVALTVQLLQADRAYQRQMLQLLNDIEAQRVPREGAADLAAYRREGSEATEGRRILDLQPAAARTY